MHCVLHHQGKRTTALVHDLSAGGLFVLTSASPDLGEPVEIELDLPGSETPLRLSGSVARRRTVPARLRSLAQGGVGVRLAGAPEEYFAFLASLLPGAERDAKPEAKPRRSATSLERRARRLALRQALGPRAEPRPVSEPPEKPDPPAAQRYRVKVKCGPRFLTITVEADSEEAARSAALREVGEGWRVLRCDPAP